MTKSIQAELPEQLLLEAHALVDQGWAADLNHVLSESLSRYLENHSSLLTEKFVREDVHWGLHGPD